MDYTKLIDLFIKHFENLENCTLNTFEDNSEDTKMFALTHDESNLTCTFRLESNGFVDFWGDFGDRKNFKSNHHSYDFDVKSDDYLSGDQQYFEALFEAIKNNLFNKVKYTVFDMSAQALVQTSRVVDNKDNPLDDSVLKYLLQVKDENGNFALNSKLNYMILVEDFSWSILKYFKYENSKITPVE